MGLESSEWQLVERRNLVNFILTCGPTHSIGILRESRLLPNNIFLLLGAMFVIPVCIRFRHHSALPQ